MRVRLRQASIRFISIAICIFMLISSRPVDAGLCCASHSHVGAGAALHEIHDGFVHSHELDAAKCLHADEEGPHQECCQTHSHIPVDCTQVFALPDKGKAGQSFPATAARSLFIITGSEFPKDRLITGLFTTVDTTPIFLRTVVLLL